MLYSFGDFFSYSYQVFIQIGMWYDNGIIVRVGMIFFGEDGNSDIIYFMDFWRESKFFICGSVNMFIFNFLCYLGQVYKIKIWYNNVGKSFLWFLYQVGVKDFFIKEMWYFIVNRWFVVESFDGVIDVEVLVVL